MYIDDDVGAVNPNWERKVAEDLISETPEELSVDWKEYWQRWGRGYNPEVQKAFESALLEKGILSEDPEEHFLVIVRPLQWAQPSLVAVGPLTTHAVSARTVLFFTKFEYAQEWARSWPEFESDRHAYYIVESHIAQFVQSSAALHSAAA